jgi:superfamily II DNA or RNA helicase
MNTEHDLTIQKLNHATLKIHCSMDIALELSSAFSFLVDGYKFMPSYKMGKFDGYIRLFNVGSRTIASGLYHRLVEFAVQREYTYTVVSDDSGYEPPNYQTPHINEETVRDYMESLDLYAHKQKIEIRDYQVKGVVIALRDRNGILLSSVGSGKSLILYTVFRYLTEELGLRALMIVPTVGLTTQMLSDFKDYSSSNGYDVTENVHLISAGVTKDTAKPIVISTFQSLKDVSPEWINSFGAIVCDEGHSITAKSFQDIYAKAIDVPYRLAVTGTLHNTKCNMLAMEALTGQVYTIAVTKDLIKANQLVPLKIKYITLNYSKDTCKAFNKAEYEDEIKWITSNPKRNNFIKKLSINSVGTTLVFFRFIAQGKEIFKLIKEAVGDSRQVFIIDGGVSKEDRESIRLLANSVDAIIVCSYGTMKMGINLPGVQNIILGHPVKGGITFLQTLGRGLRLKPGKTHCNLFDIADDLTHKSSVNHTFRHGGDRLIALTREGYEFSVVNVNFE